MNSSQSLQINAPAKVNLYLEITGKRDDGYHLLHSLMQKIDLYDVLSIGLAGEQGIELTCSDSLVPEDDSNLVWQAANLFLESGVEAFGLQGQGVIIHLDKKIPIAAGLGGGSSDAAATLRGLNQLFSCPFNHEQLSAIGLRLGADVPFFLKDNGTYLAQGIGEVLSSAETMVNTAFVIVNPGFHVSTKWVYDNFALTNCKNTYNLGSSRGDLARLWEESATKQQFPVDLVFNDLETVTITEYPEIKSIKEELLHYGAIAALMSGSGPTVFGVFEKQQIAEKCCEVMRRKYHFACTATPLA
jgi:4-diphosphocytidyl-2-C-methyl-D-erythritol kinase